MRGKIKQVVDDYAAAIINEVMIEHRMSEYAFRKSRTPNSVKARTAAIVRLFEHGFSTVEISIQLGADPKTVLMRLNPAVAARELERQRSRYQKKKMDEVRA